jgi:hypothetical protein
MPSAKQKYARLSRRWSGFSSSAFCVSSLGYVRCWLRYLPDIIPSGGVRMRC